MSDKVDKKRGKPPAPSEVVHADNIGPLTVVPTGHPGLTAVVPYSTRQLMEMSEDTPIQLCPHNIDLSEEDGVARLLNMAGRGHMEVANGKSVRIRARYYLLYPDVVTDEETGEVSPIIRTVIADSGGRVVASTSQVIPKRLKQILAACPLDRYPDGVPVEIVDRPSKRPGRHYHDIRVLSSGEECP